VSKEEKLMRAAIAVTGDDSINHVAEFFPKGAAETSAAGLVAGAAVGGAVTGGDSGGSSAGAVGGWAATRAAMGLTRDLPSRLCVAVSPDEVYLLGMKPVGYHVEPFAEIRRDKLGVEVHKRLSVRTVILEDHEAGYKFPLEAPRLNFYHAKTMIELLMLSDQHHADEVEDEEPEEA
jgi:hypothetical protein